MLPNFSTESLAAQINRVRDENIDKNEKII
jgi:hypothetical protein